MQEILLEKLKNTIELEVLDLINRRLECEIKPSVTVGVDEVEIIITGMSLGAPFISIYTVNQYEVMNAEIQGYNAERFIYKIAREIGMNLTDYIYKERSKYYGL